MTSRPMLRAALALALGAVIAPVLLGLAETAHLAAQAGAASLFSQPGVLRSLVLSLWTGLAGTALALFFALGLCALSFGTRAQRSVERAFAPILAAPHAAMAIGLAFLIAPSGWLVRLASPWATGFALPPGWPVPQDPWGLSLILGLALKETPFLAFMAFAALGRIPVAAHLAAGRALGHPPRAVWARIILPQLAPLIRGPVWAALSYALTNVDMALILGPGAPPTLGVLAARWFLSPEQDGPPRAALAALLLAGVAGGAILLWRAAEAGALAFSRRAARSGARGGGHALGVGGGAAAGLLGLGFAALAGLALWSFSWRWSFPRALPETWSLRFWSDAEGWGAALATTALIAAAAATLALLLAVLWLEGEDRARRRAPWAEALLYLPLIAPQLAFLYGLGAGFLRLGLGAGVAPVVWAHLIFVFPYVMLALAGPWRALDRRMIAAGAALGAGPARRLFALKLPLLLRPLLGAGAVGVAVSVAQYLPTLFIGAGRVETLTTEAVALASGSDRRVTAVYAALQALLPWLGFALAMGVPALSHRNRRGLRGAR